MKLVIAIVHDEDSYDVIDSLTEKGFQVTKLATTGGFLKSGNTTLIIGVEKDKVEEVLDIIKNVCKTRKTVISAPSPVMGTSGVFVSNPMEVTIGGATVFVIDVDKFEKF
ncbi:Uncharacterized protein YaaQ [Caloramator fervidus]|uniref:Uncharacterized protein YaaQ n=1 Tax=Caloramator fervidus TaxID=29344 RepID=A0A1H5XR81_9CLOT|nr:cyclic-di-AMP receptor [Caloramator fervidus]SEG13947.1 Uncharacterized protein YaaQ [Caloramator fervidus]